MEIRHTIEILTKDIQEIEKLVRNLQNYPVPPQIEIDLAMARLRNVYELLYMMSADIRSGRLPEEGAGGPAADRTRVKDEKTADAEGTESGEKPQSQGVEGTGEGTGGKPEKISAEGTAEGTGGKPEKLSAEGKVAEDAGAEGGNLEGADGRQETAEHPKEQPSESPGETSILAEKFAAERSINEKIAPEGKKDLSSKITGEPIDSIRRHVGINDRFMIIRELLNGDNDQYDRLIRQLDECQDFNQAYAIIETAFPGQMDHEGVDILVKLSRRRFISSNV